MCIRDRVYSASLTSDMSEKHNIDYVQVIVLTESNYNFGTGWMMNKG
jgi:hypothetical protein